MLDELKEEEIVNRVGGRFKLSTLIQKRMVALNTGAKPLVEVKGGDKMTIVIQEILQEKIFLDLEGNLRTRPADEFEAFARLHNEQGQRTVLPRRHNPGNIAKGTIWSWIHHVQDFDAS